VGPVRSLSDSRLLLPLCLIQWEFEENIFKKAPSCTVHTFDCTSSDSMPDAIRSRVNFHKVCLGEKNEEVDGMGTMQTWTTMLSSAGVTTTPSHIKMDIEGYAGLPYYKCCWRSLTPRSVHRALVLTRTRVTCYVLGPELARSSPTCARVDR
jgi:hypothetical protein